MLICVCVCVAVCVLDRMLLALMPLHERKTGLTYVVWLCVSVNVAVAVAVAVKVKVKACVYEEAGMVVRIRLVLTTVLAC